MDEAVLLGPFWSALAANAPPDTQLALAGTSRLARDAVVQCAASAQLTVRLSPPPFLGTLGLLRSSGRTLPATVIIHNNSFAPLDANRMACLIMPQLSCPAVTSLELYGAPWLVDTALLTAISAALPALSSLGLSNITMPSHLPAPAAPNPAWPSLRTVSVYTYIASQPAALCHLLAALGIRAGGGVTNLSLTLADRPPLLQQSMLMPVVTGYQMHALRKLHLDEMQLSQWGAGEVGGALIRHAPALEHLKVSSLRWEDDEHGTSAMCVPWRIVEVQELDVSCMAGLPLGLSPGQPPLILRVVRALTSHGAHHLVSPAPDKRQLQLECTRAAYTGITTQSDVDSILRVLTLTTTGLSNLILDGIDSADDIKDLVDLSTTGLTITFDEDDLLCPGDLVGLHDLPRVTQVEVRADDPGSWAGVDEQLLASLPAHVTDVRLSGFPSLEVVARMCVEVSRLPHRQAHTLRLCVPGAVGWLEAAAHALHAAGITATGVLGVPQM